MLIYLILITINIINLTISVYMCACNLWKSSIIPNVSMMRKAISDIAESALLYILLNRVEWILRRDLRHAKQETIITSIILIASLCRRFIKLPELLNQSVKVISYSLIYTSILAFVHLGTSTTILKTFVPGVDLSGMS
jgi:hypothetical protein